MIRSTFLAAERSPSAVTFENAAKLLAIIETNSRIVKDSKYADLKPEASKPLANMIRTITNGPIVVVSKKALKAKSSEKDLQ